MEPLYTYQAAALTANTTLYCRHSAYVLDVIRIKTLSCTKNITRTKIMLAEVKWYSQ